MKGLRRLTALLLAALSLLCCACTPQDGETETDAPPASPRRVAVLFSSLAEMWRDAGGEIAITVGETVERGFAPEGTPLVDSGAGKEIHAELLLSHSPDLVILSKDIPAQMALVETLKQAGIPVLALHVETFSDYLAAFRTMTELTGNEKAYETVGLAQKTEIDALLQSERFAALQGKDFLFIRAGSRLSSVKVKKTSEHFAAAMLAEFGVHSLADDGAFSGTVNTESLLSADPDYLFFATMGDDGAARACIEELLQSEPFQALTAVKEGRVYILPKELFHYKPNAHWWEAYEYLGNTLVAEEA